MPATELRPHLSCHTHAAYVVKDSQWIARHRDPSDAIDELLGSANHDLWGEVKRAFAVTATTPATKVKAHTSNYRGGS